MNSNIATCPVCDSPAPVALPTVYLNAYLEYVQMDPPVTGDGHLTWVCLDCFRSVTAWLNAELRAVA